MKKKMVTPIVWFFLCITVAALIISNNNKKKKQQQTMYDLKINHLTAIVATGFLYNMLNVLRKNHEKITQKGS